MLLPANMLDDATAQRLQIDKSMCEQHWNRLRNLTLIEQQQLQQTLFQLYSDNNFAEKTDPEQMLYSGFFDDHDKRLMNRVRQADADTLANVAFEFRDARLGEILFRYRARNFPSSLNPAEQTRWKAFCQWRLTDKEAQSSLTLPEFHARLAQLAADANLSEQQQLLLKKLQVYADGLQAQ